MGVVQNYGSPKSFSSRTTPMYSNLWYLWHIYGKTPIYMANLRSSNILLILCEVSWGDKFMTFMIYYDLFMATTAIKKYTTHPATHPISPTKMDQPLTLWKAKIAMENHHFKWVNQRTFYGHFQVRKLSQSLPEATWCFSDFEAKPSAKPSHHADRRPIPSVLAPGVVSVG